MTTIWAPKMLFNKGCVSHAAEFHLVLFKEKKKTKVNLPINTGKSRATVILFTFYIYRLTATTDTTVKP